MADVQRRRLGHELRRLREEAGLTQDEAGEWIFRDQNAISRLELGHRRIRPGELSRLLDAYGVEDQALRHELGTLAKAGSARGWWARYTSTISRNYASYIGFEADAREISVWEPSIVHGLLQTEDYARAVIRATGPEITDEELQRRVEIRMTRQQQLTKTKPRLWVILDESVLYRSVGDERVMRKQIDAMLDMLGDPLVNIQVMPHERGPHPGALGAFTILAYADGSTVTYAETVAGDLYPEGEEARQCTLAFDHLRATALDAASSVEVLRKARERSAR